MPKINAINFLENWLITAAFIAANNIAIEFCFFSYLYVLYVFLWPFHGFIDKVAWEMTGNGMRGRGDGVQQMATGLTQTTDCCSKDKASVHESHALPTELLGLQSLVSSLILRAPDFS